MTTATATAEATFTGRPDDIALIIRALTDLALPGAVLTLAGASQPTRIDPRQPDVQVRATCVLTQARVPRQREVRAA